MWHINCLCLSGQYTGNGQNKKEHLENLKEVLTRLEMTEMRLKEQKCAFIPSEVKYFGHRITPEGQPPTRIKMKAIKEAPALTRV